MGRLHAPPCLLLMSFEPGRGSWPGTGEEACVPLSRAEAAAARGCASEEELSRGPVVCVRSGFVSIFELSGLDRAPSGV